MDKKEKFVEEVGLFYEGYGVSRMLGRVLGWLLIMNPPAQTMKQLTEGLKVSKGSISAATNSLIQMGMIQKTRVPGERSDRYQLVPGMIISLLRRRMEGLATFSTIFEKAINILDLERSERFHDLKRGVAWISFIQGEMPILMERFEKEYKEK
ncbi:MAG: GbsR/MarR family transcriptional regulator [Candidatus Kariarchaeaceae archaeon]